MRKALALLIISLCLASCSRNGDDLRMNYAQKMINDSKDPILEILTRIQEKSSYGDNLEVLTSGELVIYLIGEVESEVNNGGFSQYFFNTSGERGTQAIQALKDIGATYTSSLLEKAQVVYQNGPTSKSLNDLETDELSEEQEEKLNDLDNQFYKYKENLSELQIAYIQKNIREFR